jgi:hypothetical protein
MPGDITSGGRTSGEVMAANTPNGAVQPGPAGTPGIPRGAEGNTGGTAMGGTTPASPPGATASASGNAAAPTGTAGATAMSPQAAASAALKPASAAAAPAPSDAQKQQQELLAAMDAAAERWRARAATEHWPTHPATAVAPASGVQASANPPNAPARGAQAPIRSEKLGTAPPSPDVKQPANAPTDTHVDRSAPAAAGPKPHL